MDTNTGSMVDPRMTVAQAWASYVGVSTVDPVTMRSYESLFMRHIEPALGRRAVADLDRDDVVELLASLRSAGLGLVLVRHCRMVLTIICRRAMALGELDEIPTHGVVAPRAPASTTRVMTPEEFVRIREALPTAGARLLADLLVRSGVRLGEAFALMLDDVDGDGISVRRCLSEPGRRFSRDGQRWALRPSTKNGAPRRVVVGRELVSTLRSWSATHALAGDDLLFPRRLVLPQASGRTFPRKVHTEPLSPERLEQLGRFTGPNGLEYQHGTMNGYVTGRCREACCRQAISEYSAAKRRERRERREGTGRARRANVLGPADPATEATGPAAGAVGPGDWARLWAAAVTAAGLDFTPLPRQTRHAHASWLNGGGVSVEQIADRLGHRDERSTRWYVRPVGQEPSAVAVMDALLGGGRTPAEPGR